MPLSMFTKRAKNCKAENRSEWREEEEGQVLAPLIHWNTFRAICSEIATEWQCSWKEREKEGEKRAGLDKHGRQQQTVWCSTLLVLEAKRNLIKQSTPSPVHRLVFISPFSTERRTLCHLNIQARLDAIVRFFLYSFFPFRYTPPFLLFFTESRRYRSQLEISDFIRFIDLFRRRQVQTANFIYCVKTFK